MPTSADLALVDTNVLVYALFPDAPQHAAARALLGRAQEGDARLCISLTVVSEFLSVVTDPRRVTSPRSPEDAAQAVESILGLPGMMLIPVPVDVVERVLDLVRRYRVTGSALFDFQIMATMLGNGLTRVYTYNRSDFEKVGEIEVLTP
jgi:toxin-antitoxin system PIN domain toxin